MQKEPNAAGGRRVADAVCAAASSADAAVLGLTLLGEVTYPRRRHRRRRRHSFLESLQVPCVHVVVHTATHQLCVGYDMEELVLYVLVSADCLIYVARRELI